jgi:pyruvate formate lyase activating enzyme
MEFRITLKQVAFAKFMKFGGYRACSLVDFPGKISAVLFTQGCSFRCPFCHNPGLVLHASATSLSEELLLDFLKTRIGKLQGVVISGGEPTIHPELESFIKKIKSLGFSVKLDTNGSHPEVVEALLKTDLINYWAIDRKASLANYSRISGVQIEPETIQKSSTLIMNATENYEFRTTVIREFHPPEEILTIAQELAHARRYILQQFRPNITLDPSLGSSIAYSPDEMEHLCTIARPFVKECCWR